MSSQNIKNYTQDRFKVDLDYSKYFDITLSSEGADYDDEVIFSKNLVGEFDGNRLPINIDLNSDESSNKKTLLWNVRQNDNVIVSKNFYNPNNIDITCFTDTSVCDIGLTSIDVGLHDKMSGQTITFSMGVNDEKTFDPYYYDRRFKMRPLDTFAKKPNERFSGNTKTIYNIVSKNNSEIGYYNELYGGFYQGFYKLYGYDYEVFPERTNKGWSSEVMVKPRQRHEFDAIPKEKYLNEIYPENDGFFFYLGTRAENKFYHPAEENIDNPPLNAINNRCKDCEFNFTLESSSGTTFNYDSVTFNLDCLTTCNCNEGESDCIKIYPEKEINTVSKKSSCGQEKNEIISSTPVDPAMDVVSNAMGVRFKGDPKNPKICVRYIKMTGDCVTNITCEKTNTKYCSGYTINEICSSKGIYDVCNYNDMLCEGKNTEERWVMISTVFERYQTIGDNDLLNWGGLGDVRNCFYPSSINNNPHNLVSSNNEKLKNSSELSKKWLYNKDKRLGSLKIYVNGFLFMVIEDFEEIIPRELNTEKEKQIGVPFNVSFGGGSIGLRESLIFKDCNTPYGPYMQDPQLMSNDTLSGTTYSGLRNNMIIEPNFAGTFMGGISQFRMYTEPLNSPQVQHNFRILKSKFDLFDYWCPNCYSCLQDCYFNFELSENLCEFDFSTCEVDCDFDIVIKEISNNFDFTVNNNLN